MGTHYICGDCQTIAVTQERCKDSECKQFDELFDVCTCVDGSHNRILEDEQDEIEE